MQIGAMNRPARNPLEEIERVGWQLGLAKVQEKRKRRWSTRTLPSAC
jgi:hypothetical protein